jgi:hypothetical protein
MDNENVKMVGRKDCEGRDSKRQERARRREKAYLGYKCFITI